MLEYSDYKSLVDTLKQSNQENTYQDIMKKEATALDTINRVIKYYRDEDIKEKQFVNMPISFVVYRFFTVWIEIFDDLVRGKDDILSIFNKDDRLVYIGVMFIILSICLYYVEITRPVATV